MKIKIIEIRDEGTLIPVMAWRMSPDNVPQRKLIARGGYGMGQGQSDYVWVQQFTQGEGKGTSDVYKWDGSRTMHEAHKYIKANFDELRDGDVVDVQFILGETKEKKVSEIQGK